MMAAQKKAMQAANLKTRHTHTQGRDKEVRSSGDDKARALLSIFPTLQKEEGIVSLTRNQITKESRSKDLIGVFKHK